jgi:hypothetical protein
VIQRWGGVKLSLCTLWRYSRNQKGCAVSSTSWPLLPLGLSPGRHLTEGWVISRENTDALEKKRDPAGNRIATLQIIQSDCIDYKRCKEDLNETIPYTEFVSANCGTIAITLLQRRSFSVHFAVVLRWHSLGTTTLQQRLDSTKRELCSSNSTYTQRQMSYSHLQAIIRRKSKFRLFRYR